MKKVFLILSLLLTFDASASAVNGAIIDQVLIGEVYGNMAFIRLKTKPTLPEGHCSTNSNYNYVFDISTQVGKATLSMVLSAYAAQKPVYANGYDVCTIYSNVENLRQLRLQQFFTQGWN